jgi:hypothetical protein
MTRLFWVNCGIISLTVLISGLALADEDSNIDGGDRPIAKADIVVVRSFTAPRVGQFHVIVRKDGHQRKMPYLFEIRPACGGPRRKWEQLNAGTVESSCEANAKTIEYDAKMGVVTMMVRNVDWEGYDKKIRKVGNEKAGEPVCKKDWETSTLKLRDLCPQ